MNAVPTATRSNLTVESVGRSPETGCVRRPLAINNAAMRYVAPNAQCDVRAVALRRAWDDVKPP